MWIGSRSTNPQSTAKIGYGDNMATDVDVTTATWGTEALKKNTGEIYDKIAQNQIADNAGYNYHYPHLLFEDTNSATQISTGTDTQSTVGGVARTGLFLVYGRVNSSCTVQGGTVKLTLDGTQIFEFASSSPWTGTVNSFLGTISPATGWISGMYYAIPLLHGTATISNARIYLAGI